MRLEVMRYFYYELAGLAMREEYARSSSRQCYQLLISWASWKESVYLVSNKCVDLTFDTDTNSDKTAMSAFIRNGYQGKKYFNPSLSFSKQDCSWFLFFYLSPRKRYCENTLKVPNLILITSLCKTGKGCRRMKTNRWLKFIRFHLTCISHTI